MGIVFTYYERFLWSALATFGCIFAPFVGGIAYALFKAAFPIQTRKMGKVLCTGKPAKPSSRKLEVAELRRELADRKLSTKGKKKALVKRLDAAMTFVKADTYLSINLDGIRDTAVVSNGVTQQDTTNAMGVTNFLDDLVRPTLRAFNLNLTSELLWMSFSETIRVSTIKEWFITFQSDNGTVGTGLWLQRERRLRNAPSL